MPLKITEFSIGDPLRGINVPTGNHQIHLELTLAIFNPFFSLVNLQTFTQTLFLTCWLFTPQKHKVNQQFHIQDLFVSSHYSMSHTMKISEIQTSRRSRGGAQGAQALPSYFWTKAKDHRAKAAKKWKRDKCFWHPTPSCFGSNHHKLLCFHKKVHYRAENMQANIFSMSFTWWT